MSQNPKWLSVKIKLSNKVLFNRFCNQIKTPDDKRQARFLVQPTLVLFAKTTKQHLISSSSSTDTELTITFLKTQKHTLKSMHVLGSYFGLRDHKNILSTPFFCKTVKMRCHTIGVILSTSTQPPQPLFVGEGQNPKLCQKADSFIKNIAEVGQLWDTCIIIQFKS